MHFTTTWLLKAFGASQCVLVEAERVEYPTACKTHRIFHESKRNCYDSY